MQGGIPMPSNQKILTIQDISCFGQCSTTVALPIISALGIETAILPTAILSTHTAGFKGFTFRDLKEDIPSIVAHWEKENIRFNAIYTGYLGHQDDVKEVLELDSKLNEGPLIVDPAFGDNGALYGGFDANYVKAMAKLCSQADILLPNLTEACALLNIPYSEYPSDEQIDEILLGLTKLGAKAIVLKGLGKDHKQTGITVYSNGIRQDYRHDRLSKSSHGTGDVFASVFVASLIRGLPLLESAKTAADFTYQAIKATQNDPTHWYGVKYEPLLTKLGNKIDGLLK